MVLVWDTRRNITSKSGIPFFIILYAIKNEKYYYYY